MLIRTPRNRFAAVETNPMMLDALQLLERPLGREPGVGTAQARPHDPVQDQRDEADRGMGADALGQSVIDGPISSSDLSTLKPRSMSARDL